MVILRDSFSVSSFFIFPAAYSLLKIRGISSLRIDG